MELPIKKDVYIYIGKARDMDHGINLKTFKKNRSKYTFPETQKTLNVLNT